MSETGTVAQVSSEIAPPLIGTVVNTIQFGELGALANDPNTAASFGADGCVDVGDAVSLDFTGQKAFTLEAWAYVSGTTTTPREVLSKLGNDGGSAACKGYTLGIVNDAARFRLCDGLGGSGAVSSTVKILLGAWNHLVATFDGNTKSASIYVNGNKTTDTFTVTPGNTGAPFAMGCRIWSGPKDFLNGKIDEAAVYATVLTAADVADHLAKAK